LGTFMDTDFSFRKKFKMTIEIIQVSFNIRAGLEKYLEFAMEESHFCRSLDYEGIHFLCR